MGIKEILAIPLPEEIVEEAIRMRRHFHKYPELSQKELKTQETIKAFLEDLQIEVRSPVAKTGLIGYLPGKRRGKTALLRADMDALPIQDRKDAPYRSTVPNVMHACGHDAHMAILLGVAMFLKRNQQYLEGDVRLIFQPAEETVGGAKPMIEEGALDGADYALALHMDSSLPVGEIALACGPSHASSYMLKASFVGRGGHGAAPQQGIDALLMAAQFLNSAQTLVSRRDPLEPVVLSFGTIQGGEAPNVIAREVRMEGILRTVTKETQDSMLQGIRDHLEAVAKASGGSTALESIPSYPPVVNDPNVVALLERLGVELLGGDRAHRVTKPSMGVEDFSYFLEKVPGAMWRLGCGNKSKRIVAPAHSPDFDIDEEAIGLGIRLQASAALLLLDRES